MTLKNKLLKLKSIDKIQSEGSVTEESNQLKRTLGPINLINIGIGAIIGAGIFVLTGQAAAVYAGPAVIISFIVAGIACVFAGLCYAEFASMIPIAGSVYTYAYTTLGEFVAWIIGWDLILEYLFGASTISVGWSGYMVSFLKDFGIVVPSYLSQAPLNYVPAEGWVTTGSFLNLPAMLIVFLLTIILSIGIKESVNFNNTVVVIKLFVIFLFIGFGFSFVNMDNLVPFIPANSGVSGEYGWSGIFRAAGLVFYAYIGFDAVSTAAQETKNPQRNMPIGILGSLAVSTLVYILVAFVMTGMIDFKLLNVADPIAVAINSAGEELVWLRPFIKIGAIAGLSSCALAYLMGQSRVFFSMATDGLLPHGFQKLHPKFKTPIFSTCVTGFFAMLISGLFPIGLLGEMVSIGTLLAFVIVCVAVLILRYKRPELHRPFRTPFMPFIPILGVISCVFVMASLPIQTWIRLIVWMGVGIAIYFIYGIRNSKIQTENKAELI